jgi:hypothetical protein
VDDAGIYRSQGQICVVNQFDQDGHPGTACLGHGLGAGSTLSKRVREQHSGKSEGAADKAAKRARC